jgi:hypothetical protein
MWRWLSFMFVAAFLVVFVLAGSAEISAGKLRRETSFGYGVCGGGSC